MSAGSRSVHAQERSALATEVIRVASKNVSGSCVKFAHRSVFPVLFDADSVGAWWKSALVFKVYCRNANEKVPHLLGTCSLPLKHLLRAEALYVARALEVKDRCRAGSRERVNLNSSQVDDLCPVVGQLKVVTTSLLQHDCLYNIMFAGSRLVHLLSQVTAELASDSKDFSSALAKTRLAELTHPLQIVPIERVARSEKKASSSLKPGTATMQVRVDEAEDVVHLPPPSPRSSRRVASQSPRGGRSAMLMGGTGDATGSTEVSVC